MTLVSFSDPGFQRSIGGYQTLLRVWLCIRSENWQQALRWCAWLRQDYRAVIRHSGRTSQS